MQVRDWSRSLWVLTVGLIALVLGGCGGSGPNLVPVKGRVFLDDEPVAGVIVTFTPLDTSASVDSAGTTDDDGYYTVKTAKGRIGAVVGEHRVRINPTVKDTMSPEERMALIAETDDDDDIPQPEKTVEIPAKYNAQSRLTFTVPSEGTDEAVFELQSE